MVMNVDLVDTVGDAASSLGMYVRCGTPFMHARPLTSPVLFSLRNMSDESACIYCSLDSLLTSSGVQVSIMWSCVSSLTAAVAPLAPNFLRPGFKLYCVIMYAHTIISSCDVVHNFGSIACVVSSIVGSIGNVVVASSLSSLVIRVRGLASSTLLCTRTAPSCRNVVRGAYVS